MSSIIIYSYVEETKLFLDYCITYMVYKIIDNNILDYIINKLSQEILFELLDEVNWYSDAIGTQTHKWESTTVYTWIPVVIVTLFNIPNPDEFQEVIATLPGLIFV